MPAPAQAPPLQRAPSGDNPLQLQEYYAAQSDLLDELIKERGVHNPQILAALQGLSAVPPLNAPRKSG